MRSLGQQHRDTNRGGFSWNHLHAFPLFLSSLCFSNTTAHNTPEFFSPLNKSMPSASSVLFVVSGKEEEELKQMGAVSVSQST
jgi:hypothetical protein